MASNEWCLSVWILMMEMSEIVSPTITKSMATTDKLVLGMPGHMLRLNKTKSSWKTKKLERNQTNRMDFCLLKFGVLAMSGGICCLISMWHHFRGHQVLSGPP